MCTGSSDRVLRSGKFLGDSHSVIAFLARRHGDGINVVLFLCQLWEVYGLPDGRLSRPDHPGQSEVYITIPD